MTFADLDLPQMPGGFGVWKSSAIVENGDWGTAEDALCNEALPVIDEKRAMIGGYYASRNEKQGRLALYLMRRPR